MFGNIPVSDPYEVIYLFFIRYIGHSNRNK